MIAPLRAPRGAAVRPLVVAALGLGVGVVLALRLLVPAAGNPSVFLALGEESTVQTDYARRLLGDVVTRDLQGHDGKFFFIQATDPLLLDPDHHAVFLDRPRYRSQRMLFPLLAGGLGLLPVGLIPWMMAAVTVLSFGVGTWFTAEIARREGGSPWLGLAFALNLGLISELFVGGAGVLALALALGGTLAVMEDRTGWAAAAFAGASLTREAMILFVLGVAVLYWRRRGLRPALGVVAPGLAGVGLWWVYVAVRLGHLAAVPSIQEIDLRFPFAGLVDAWAVWRTGPVDLVFGLVLVAILVLFALRALRRPGYLAAGSLGYVALAAVLAGQVWGHYFDISRALAPVLTAYVVSVFTPGGAQGSGVGTVSSSPAVGIP